MIRSVSLLVSFAAAVVLRRVAVFDARGRAVGGGRREALVHSIALDDLASSRLKQSVGNGEVSNGGGSSAKEAVASVERRPASEGSDDVDDADSQKLDPGMFDDIEPSGLPIYLGDASDSTVRALDYRHLASVWNRDSSFDDILRQASDGADDADEVKEELKRELNDGLDVTVLFHTSPKTGSSTLRRACLETQYDTCDLPRKNARNKWPEGYRTPKRLTQLFERCPGTRHFCVKDVPLTSNFTGAYDERTFLHLFPFRNYDEWARSALHQISYRDGEGGCADAEELLDECRSHKFELDFKKYTKVILSNFTVSMEHLRERGTRQRAKRIESHHHLMLHDYRKLDDTLTWLHEEFGIPLLPGTGRKENSERPKESCGEEERMLEKFHNCFSEALVTLP